MAKKLTPLQQEYRKELRRLKQGFKRYEAKGYIFPDYKYDPSTTKITRKKVEALKKLKPKELTTVAEQIDIDTGEIISSPSNFNYTPQTNIQQETVSNDYIPDLSIIDAIRDKINSLPDTNNSARGGIPIANRRNALADMFEDIINSLSDDELQSYIEWLLKNQHELFQQLDKITYDSKEERIDASFARVGVIINQGNALSGMQAEALNSMQEFI